MTYEQAQSVLAQLPDTEKFEEDVVMLFYDTASHLPVPPVFSAWFPVIDRLYEQNVPRDLPPEPAKGTIQHARWRDIVNERCVPPDLSSIAAVIVQAMHKFTEYLPPMAKVAKKDFNPKAPASFSAPLWDLVTDKHKMVDAVFCTFCYEDYLPVLKDRLTDNIFKLSGNPKTKEKLVFPEQFKSEPLMYFDGTPLINIFFAPCPINIPEYVRFTGQWICAKSGSGKTTMLYAMLVDDIKKDASIIILDSKGELNQEVKSWRCIKDRLVIIEPNEQLQLNPLSATHSIDLLEYIFSSLLQTDLTPKQRGLFRSVLRATLRQPNPTINTFKDIMRAGTNNPPPDLEDFFANDFKDAEYNRTKEEIKWRLHLLMENPIARGMFSAPQSLLNIGELMDSGKVVVINNSKKLVGDFGSEFFGRLFVALVYAEAIDRQGREYKKPCYLYLDEANNVIARDKRIENILDECRSQKIALVVAHQRENQLEPPVRDALYHCGIKTTAGERTGVFNMEVADVGAYTMCVEPPVLPEHMSNDEQAALLSEMHSRYCRSNAVEHPATLHDAADTSPGKDW